MAAQILIECNVPLLYLTSEQANTTRKPWAWGMQTGTLPCLCRSAVTLKAVGRTMETTLGLKVRMWHEHTDRRIGGSPCHSILLDLAQYWS